MRRVQIKTEARTLNRNTTSIQRVLIAGEEGPDIRDNALLIGLDLLGVHHPSQLIDCRGGGRSERSLEGIRWEFRFEGSLGVPTEEEEDEAAASALATPVLI